MSTADRAQALELCRFRGALLGLAAGDALGTTVEFQPPGSFPPVTDMVGGGVFRLEPGQWTDDTSMALCLAESLLKCGGFDPADQLERYRRWFREGYWSSTGDCFDIGNAVRGAVMRFERTGNGWSGSDDPMQAGNGSIMRLVPAVLFEAAIPERAIGYAEQSSRTTHAAPECLDACRLMAAILLGALHGWGKKELLREDAFDRWLGVKPLNPRIEDIRRGSYKLKQPPAIKGTGYVVDSLEAALWAFAGSSSFEEGALLAVNLGDDADTTGAVYGQIAGAYYGEDGIPSRWLQLLARGEDIRELADGLFHHATA